LIFTYCRDTDKSIDIWVLRLGIRARDARPYDDKSIDIWVLRLGIRARDVRPYDDKSIDIWVLRLGLRARYARPYDTGGRMELRTEYSLDLWSGTILIFIIDDRFAYVDIIINKLGHIL
jgi:hypothetical protein